jgi:uncharacterized protein YuzE
MKVKYDQQVDILYISFNDEEVHESDEEKPGVIIDYSKDGSVVGIEILDASKHMTNPTKVEYEVA